MRQTGKSDFVTNRFVSTSMRLLVTAAILRIDAVGFSR